MYAIKCIMGLTLHIFNNLFNIHKYLLVIHFFVFTLCVWFLFCLSLNHLSFVFNLQKVDCRDLVFKCVIINSFIYQKRLLKTIHLITSEGDKRLDTYHIPNDSKYKPNKVKSILFSHFCFSFSIFELMML